MKLIFLHALLAFSAFSLRATPPLPPKDSSIVSGSALLPFVAGRVQTYQLLNDEKRNLGSLSFSFDKAAVGNYKVQKNDASGRLLSTADGKWNCTGLETLADWTPKIVDVLAAYRDKKCTFLTNELRYPATLRLGDTLTDGNLHLLVEEENKVCLEVQISATKRRVEMQETVSIGKTTYTCYKITYLQTVKTRRNGQEASPVLLQQTEWLAPKIGIVKSSCFSVAIGKTIQTMLLTQLTDEITAPAAFDITASPPLSLEPNR